MRGLLPETTLNAIFGVLMTELYKVPGTSHEQVCRCAVLKAL